MKNTATLKIYATGTKNGKRSTMGCYFENVQAAHRLATKLGYTNLTYHAVRSAK